MAEKTLSSFASISADEIDSNTRVAVVVGAIGRNRVLPGAQLERYVDLKGYANPVARAGLGYPTTPIDYGPGLYAASSSFTVVHNGNVYQASDDAVPFVTAEAFDPTQWVLVKGVSGNALEGDYGSMLVGFRRSDETDRITLSRLLSAKAINIWEFSGNIVSRPNPLDPETWDWQPAFQSAHDYVKALAESRGNVCGIPQIEVPGGVYRLGGQLNWTPWVILKSVGSCLLDFSSADNASNGIVCNNDTTLEWDPVLKFAGSNSPWLDGGGGTIAILGPGKESSTGVGLKIGNFQPGLKAYRTSELRNVWLGQWGTGMQIGNYDTYLARCAGIVFENNSTNLSTASGTSSNSGERMEFEHCTFGPSNTHVRHDIDAFDVTFDRCSFDFSNTVLSLGVNSRYSRINIRDSHLEAMGVVVDGTEKIINNRLVVYLDGNTVLPRGRSGETGVNSPSKVLFKGMFYLVLGFNDMRFETRPYLEDSAPIDPSVSVIDYGRTMGQGYQSHLSNGQVMNSDFDFQADGVGTLETALTHWTRLSVANVSSTASIADVSGKKVLQIIGTSGSNTSSKAFESKQGIPCSAGDVLGANLSLQAPGATGLITVQAWVAFYDDAGKMIDEGPDGRNYRFSEALADSRVPNFAEGDTRYMATLAYRVSAPAGTCVARLRWAVLSFDGTVNVSRARMFKI